ncbi:MAG: NAD-dependent succinate-semialdehyde dehydrogenase [Candidatus Delongbacteria bacterium]|jgi:succinate-semialdehyde dehydrogenase/glutarate-semialdehyde dehydrogenase|nr:NAD-dependent succinate-semialdehyde dehydrogenase [Candidatus Delongbacteria bacterium]
MKIQSINPYTEEIMAEFDLLTWAETTDKIEFARNVYKSWRDTDIKVKVRLLKNLAAVLRVNKKKYAEIITKEMGMIIRSSMGSVEKCALLCDYYADNAEKFLADEHIETQNKKSYISFEPIGIVFEIMPWNFPFWQVFRQAVTSTIAGNVCLLKHASNVPQCALAIEGIFTEAGYPDGIFTTLLIDSKTAMKVIDEDLIDAVSFTGSNQAGEKVGELAGKRIKPVVLELGGSDPFIVLEDADIDKAVQAGVFSRTLNSGQSCIAAKRFIVMKSVVDEFTKKFISEIGKLKIGDPLDETTDIAPLARPEFVKELEDQLKDAIDKNGKVFQIQYEAEKGFFFPPCVVSNISEDMKVVSEEVFGPIAPIITVLSDGEAIQIANNTEYGLGAAIFSKDIKRAEKLAKKIESGTVAINDFLKSDPRLPFGGIKKSGIGRELSEHGLKEFVNKKMIVIND